LSWKALLPEISAHYEESSTLIEGMSTSPPINKCPNLSEADKLGITAALNPMCVLPIFLPHILHEGFAAYTLSVLRPALHNVLETGSQRIQPSASSLDFLASGWRHYSFANKAVASVILSLYQPADTIWWHDFWLMRGPHFVAEEVKRRAISVGLTGEALAVTRAAQVFYMHAPFPTSEIFRTIPVRDDLLNGLLQSDVIGFHSFNYARHFLHSAKRLLGFAHHSRTGGALAVDVDGRDVLVTISPVGVEASTLDSWMASEVTVQLSKSLNEQYPPGRKVVLAGLDSMQRLSGVALKLLAFERLLEENSVYRERVVLLQRCETGGGDILPADCALTGKELRARVDSINALYGPVIDYAEAPTFSPEVRMGIFHRADILLLTPICEGLNLLPLQYVYARTKWQMQRGPGSTEATSLPSLALPVAQDALSTTPSLGLSLADAVSPLPRLSSNGALGGSDGPPSSESVLSSTAPLDAPPCFFQPSDSFGDCGGISATRGGCIILSEFSTAAHVLNSKLVVNPWSIKAVAKEIDKAITMPDEERAYRQWRDYQYAYQNPSATWSRKVIRDLEGLRNERESEKSAMESLALSNVSVSGPPPTVHAPVQVKRKPLASPLNLGDLTLAFLSAKKRVIIMDYGGTLIERSATMGSSISFGNRADFHTDGYGQLLPQPVLNALRKLSCDPQTSLYVVSGLRTSAVEALKVSSLPGVGLAAEYGLFLSKSVIKDANPNPPLDTKTPEHSTSTASRVRTSGLSRERSSRGLGAGLFGSTVEGGLKVDDTQASPRQWIRAPLDEGILGEWEAVKRCVCVVMAEYEGRVNGSVLREYDSLVAWDFRAVDAEWAVGQARFLVSDLEHAISMGGEGTFCGPSASSHVQVTLRKTRVEVSLSCINKGRLVKDILDSTTIASSAPADFVFVVGDDATDEASFEAASQWNKECGHPCSVFSATVGKKSETVASFFCADVHTVHAALLALSENAPQK